MLSSMTRKMMQRTTGAVVALALAAGAAVPVQAGESERDFLKGVAATVIVGALIQNMNRPRQPAYAPPVQYYVPPQQQPVYQRPPVYQQPVYARPVQAGIYTTAAAQAFSAYSLTERRAIQRRLAAQGYYYGGIDGAFGPGTYNAVTAYAADRGIAARLANTAGAFGIYDGLIF
jgi:hypothetical protein